MKELLEFVIHCFVESTIYDIDMFDLIKVVSQIRVSCIRQSRIQHIVVRLNKSYIRLSRMM